MSLYISTPSFFSTLTLGSIAIYWIIYSGFLGTVAPFLPASPLAISPFLYLAVFPCTMYWTAMHASLSWRPSPTGVRSVLRFRRRSPCDFEKPVRRLSGIIKEASAIRPTDAVCNVPGQTLLGGLNHRHCRAFERLGHFHVNIAQWNEWQPRWIYDVIVWTRPPTYPLMSSNAVKNVVLVGVCDVLLLQRCN